MTQGKRATADWKGEIRRRLAGLGLTPAREADIVDELSQHLQDRYAELRSSGASDAEAERCALDEIDERTLVPQLGAVERPAPAALPPLGDAARGGVFAELAGDLRYAVRTLGRHRGFAAVVILTLALGIGANTAIFSVVDAVILRPLPYPDADRLVLVRGDLHRPGLNETSASVGEFVDYRERNHVFDETAAYDTHGFNVTGGSAPERVDGAVVSPSLFRLLGIAPALGRSLENGDERPGHSDVVVLSTGLWRRRFASDPAIVGKLVTLDGRAAEVVGVMPAGFRFPDDTTELWSPIVVDADAVSADNRGSRGYAVLGRLKAGVTIAGAEADLNGPVASAFVRAFPQNYRRGFSAQVRRLQDEIVGDASRALFILLAAVSFVLLIACANVSNLLLARATTRQKEMAIRTALGASRSRIVRQLLTESLVLAAAGGSFGLLLAVWGVRLLVAIDPTSLPRLDEIGVDGRLIAFTAAASIATGLLFGLVPAIQAARPGSGDALREGGRAGGAAEGRSRARRLLVVSETALSLVLLIAAGLLGKSFARLERVSPGFDPRGLLTVRIAPAPSTYATFEQGEALFDEIVARLRGSHLVRAAAIVDGLPFSPAGGDRSFTIDGRATAGPGDSPDEQIRIVGAGYFAAMGIPIVQGREFDGHDRRAAPHVVVVNESFARKYFPGGGAIGHRIGFGGDRPNWYEIVGVARDIRHTGLDARLRPEYYVPYAQPLFEGWTVRPMFLVVRAAADPASVATTVRAVVHGLDGDQPVSDARTMADRIGASLAPRRFSTVLLGLFAALALVLAGVGIAGVIAFSVTRRTHEIGVRLALGAGRRDVVALVVGQGLSLVSAGVLVGLAAAFAMTRVLSGLLFGVSPTDPATFAGITALLFGVALVASYLPARRAARVDPVVALREE